MAVRTPRIRVVDEQRGARAELVGELRHRQVESHPRRQAVGGRDAEHGARERRRRRHRQQMLLDGDLRPRVERLRIQLAGLGRERRRVVDAVVAAGRGEDEALDAEVVERVDDGLRPVLVDLDRQLRVLLADRVADERGQQRDIRGAARRGAEGRGVRQVALDEGQPVVVQQVLDREAVVVQQVVEDAHARPGIEQRLGQHGPDVAGSADHQYGSVLEVHEAGILRSILRWTTSFGLLRRSPSAACNWLRAYRDVRIAGGPCGPSPPSPPGGNAPSAPSRTGRPRRQD